jgi:hypothetical protein
LARSLEQNLERLKSYGAVNGNLAHARGVRSRGVRAE